MRSLIEPSSSSTLVREQLTHTPQLDGTLTAFVLTTNDQDYLLLMTTNFGERCATSFQHIFYYLHLFANFF